MFVAAVRSPSVMSRCCRSARSRGPTVARTWSTVPFITTFCHPGNNACHPVESRKILSSMTTTHDVIVIGGGVAGLSGALVLARSRRSVLVNDSREPRNAPAAGVHNYLYTAAIWAGARGILGS